jgi:CubicO group peptidase (beta-lactamase class C family)
VEFPIIGIWDEEALRQYYDNPLEDVTAEEIIQRVAREADQFEAPNQQTQYNNLNYSFLERIVEKVTGNDLGTQITETIIQPLGMTNTIYPVGGAGTRSAPGMTMPFDNVMLSEPSISG